MTPETTYSIFAVYVLLGPLNFMHGLPEYGPRQPNGLAILGGLIGTLLYVGLFNAIVQVVL